MTTFTRTPDEDLHNQPITTALVTGSQARVADVAPALEKEGFSTHGAPSDAVHLPETIRHARLRARSLGCYVQLPTTDLDGDCAAPLAGLRALICNALLGRFDALAVVAPLLAHGARLVIVAGDQAGATRDSDFGLPAISCLLAEAVLAGQGAYGVHTTVVGDGCNAAEIAAVARGAAYGPGLQARSPSAVLAGYAAESTGLCYVDWRDEVLGLVAELAYGQHPDRLGPQG
jgi:hypothetical protein